MRSFLILVLLLSTIFSKAQIFRKSMFAKRALVNLENFDKQRVHFGFYLGFNNYDFKIDKKQDDLDIQSQTVVGFNVGLITNLRLTEYLDLRFEPGLSYGQRNLSFPYLTDKVDALREVKSTYITFPLLLKCSSKKIGNVRPYVIGGVSYNINLSSNADSDDDNSANRFRMIKSQNNYELGLGIDLYLEYFKFSPSIRGVFGLQNELVADKDPNSPWTSNIDKLQTRGIFINFAFH